MAHPVCFGEISAKIVTIEWPRNLFSIKTFNAKKKKKKILFKQSDYTL